MSHEPKSVLVVGASASIGESVVDAFLRRQARVLATYRTHPVTAATCSQLVTCHLDICNEQEVAAFCQGALSGFGPTDVVVVLVGVLPGRNLRNYEPGQMKQVMDVNFTSVAGLLRSIEPHLRDPCHIILMASIAAECGSYDPIYAASKGALISFAKSLAIWQAPKIRVNVVAPGLIEGSGMAAAMTEERRAYHRDQTPLKALLSKQDLGEIVADLTEDHWRHLNGAVIRVNGGTHV